MFYKQAIQSNLDGGCFDDGCGVEIDVGYILLFDSIDDSSNVVVSERVSPL